MDRLGNDDDILLQEEAQRRLGCRLVVSRADALQHRMSKEILAAFGKGAPGFVNDAVLVHNSVQLRLLMEYVRFYLIHCRHDFHIMAQVDKAVGKEIRYADSPQLAGLIRLFHGPVRSVIVAKGLMNQHEIDIISLETAQGIVDRRLRLFVSGIGNPDFRRQKDVAAHDAGLPQPLPYFVFIVIGLRRIDESVPCMQGVFDAAHAFVRRNLIDAVSDGRHFYAVI